MKPHPEKTNDVEKLVDLLHHIPPPKPRDVADQVIEGIRSPRPAGPLTWWQRLGLDFDKQPVLVCGAGVVVCGLLIYGVITTLRTPPPHGTAALLQDNAHLAPPGTPALPGNPGLPPAASPRAVPASTAPVFNPNNTPFNHGVERAVSKAGYNTGVGGN